MAAHGAEAEIVGYVPCEDELGDQSGRPIRNISPIPPAPTKKHRLEDQIGSSEEYEEILMGKCQPTTRLGVHLHRRMGRWIKLAIVGRSSRDKYCEDKYPRGNHDKRSKIDSAKQDLKDHT
jgi:hypothetical protein